MHENPARVALAAAASILVLVGAADRPAYRDPSLPVEARVQDLLGRMTLEEKVAQLGGVWGQKAAVPGREGRLRPREGEGGAGQRHRPGVAAERGQAARAGPWRTPREAVAYVNAVQKFLVEETRLGIPAMFHEEAVHGFAAPGGTHFPVPIALASTWDVDLLERVMTVAAREARARGVQQVLAPVLDLARDPALGPHGRDLRRGPLPRHPARAWPRSAATRGRACPSAPAASSPPPSTSPATGRTRAGSTPLPSSSASASCASSTCGRSRPR